MDGFEPEGAALAVTEALRAVGTAARAAQEKRYLKSELEFLGVTVPEMRRVVTGAVRGHPGLDAAGMVAWAVALWGEPVHERRMAAVEILTTAAPRLDAADLAVAERLVRESGTWALVDGLAANVAGQIGAPRSAVLAGHRPVGGGRGFLGTAVGAARAAARHPPRAAGPGAVHPVRGTDAGGAGVLHPQGDRLGIAGDLQA
jgi:DNA alkylation repair enzyme